MAKAEILLTSEDYVKSVTNISDNLSGKYLLSAIREAQDIDLCGILGECLLAKLKALYGAGELAGDYKMLVDKAQLFLAYTTCVYCIDRTSYKITNFGLARSSDENLQLANMDEMQAEKGFYQAKADAQCWDLTGWLLENRQLFPELDACGCSRKRANLTSSYSGGIVFGGPRSKIVRR